VPTYQYACTECEHRFDAVQSFTDAALTECPECDGRLRKLYGSVGVVFKGSGFYRTDSRNGKSSDAKGSGASNGSGGKSESGSGDGGSGGATSGKSSGDSSGSAGASNGASKSNSSSSSSSASSANTAAS
jgi:putative FmdB family regulatory protein